MSAASMGGRSLTRILGCLIYGFGIVGMLLLYGLWQERIMAYPYKDEYIPGSALLVLHNRVFGVGFAAIMTVVMSEELRCTAPLWKYVFISLSAVAASICQYEALKYVSFVVSMLGKSCKMLPVMVWGMVISKKHYVAIDWLTSIVVTVGVAEFLLTGRIESDASEGSGCQGLLFLVAFVVLDGLTSTFQEKLFRDHMTSKYNQMLYINLVSAVISFLMLLLSGTMTDSFLFCGRHPVVLWDASMLSGTAVAAQWCIYSQVQEFGALACAATMNVRQVVSILASYLAYGHPISAWQVVGLATISVTLFIRGFVSYLVEQNDQKTQLKLKSSNVYKPARATCWPSFKV